jgi:ectoine hydroxylase-related dioxygenase (phytanoyl-CoA dioxygenase family)
MTSTQDYDARGYGIVASVLGEREVSDLLQALEPSPLARGRAGTRHLMRHPAVARVANDARLLAIARDVLGRTGVPYRATLFDKSPQRNWLVAWHQDTALPLESRRDVAGWGPWSVKAGVTYAHAPAHALARIVALRLHLDDSDRDNGPLRVIPETHRLGVMSDAEVEQVVQSVEPVDCLVTAGGVIAMRPLILHASSKVETTRPRRVLHIEYAESLQMDDGLRVAIA